VLTAATAILAMIPLTRSVFWGPLAVAIMGGLSVATFLTLGNLPALYVLLFRVKRPTQPPAPAGRFGSPGRRGCWSPSASVSRPDGQNSQRRMA
jgi:hypothetical protein